MQLLLLIKVRYLQFYSLCRFFEFSFEFFAFCQPIKLWGTATFKVSSFSWTPASLLEQFLFSRAQRGSFSRDCLLSLEYTYNHQWRVRLFPCKQHSRTICGWCQEKAQVDEENLWLVCTWCNTLKSAKRPELSLAPIHWLEFCYKCYRKHSVDCRRYICQVVCDI